MSTNQAKTERFIIGDLELDTGTVCVRRGTSSIDLPKLSFDLLLCLVRHAPNVVNTDTLMSEVWGKVVVGDETVKQRIKLLRKALGDSSSEPSYIASVRGRGYRLVAPVERASSPASPVVSKASGHLWTMIAVMALIVILGSVLLMRMQGSDHATEPAGTSQSQAVNRIVVLPFENFSQKQQDEYLADGITEDITTALAQIDGLGVIARSSAMRYKNAGLGVAAIAAELGVGTVLEGSVQRFGEKLRITIQMVDAGSEEHYWAQSYDISLSDLPELQLSIASRVARSLEATLSKTGIEALQRNSTDSPQAYDEYLRGRAHYRRWNRLDNETALAFYQRAIELDPGFALAHAGIANAYALRAIMYAGGDEWTEKSIQQAELALSINPQLPEAHKALGLTSFYKGYYHQSLKHYQNAVELSPGYDEALFNIAEIYHLQGHWDEAVRYQLRDNERAFGAERLSVYLRDMQFDDQANKLLQSVSGEIPISFLTEGSLSLKYLVADDIEQARQHADSMRLSFPGFAFSWQRASEVEMMAGNWELAEEYINKAISLAGEAPSYPKLILAHLLQRRGENQTASTLLDEFEQATLEKISNGHEAWYHRWNMAYVQALRGNVPEALDWYEKAVEAGRRRYEWDEREPVFAKLLHEPRFQAALEKQRQSRQQMAERVLELIRTS